MDIIKVEHLSKSYGDLLAVNDISFAVKEGSFFSFLGRNGAGKSTTINILTTLLEKDSGTIYINGKTDLKQVRQDIGIVFQNNVLDDDLTVKENVMFRGAMYIANGTDLKKRYQEVSDLLELGDFQNRRFGRLSGGQKRRAEIARAIMPSPKVLVLDEPTTGLDPETRLLVWQAIENLRKGHNTTIFLTTHYLDEAINSDTIAIIDNGRIIAEGTPTELKNRLSKDRLIATPKDAARFEQVLTNNGYAFSITAGDYIVDLKDTEDAVRLLSCILDNLASFEVKKGSLDDVFINAIGGSINV